MDNLITIGSLGLRKYIVKFNFSKQKKKEHSFLLLSTDIDLLLMILTKYLIKDYWNSQFIQHVQSCPACYRNSRGESFYATNR